MLKVNTQAFSAALEKAKKELKKDVATAVWEAEKILTKEVLRETPVDTGFLRYHYTLEDGPVPVTVLSSQKTPDNIAGLSVDFVDKQEPSGAELSRVMGTKPSDSEILTKTRYLGNPVEYGELTLTKSRRPGHIFTAVQNAKSLIEHAANSRTKTIVV